MFLDILISNSWYNFLMDYKAVKERIAKIVCPMNNIKAGLIIFVLGLIIFSSGLANGFVIDDQSQIVENPDVHSLTNIGKVFTGGTFNNGNRIVGVYYKPIMQIYFAVTNSLFGFNPFAFHFLQILLHIINAILLFVLLKNFFSPSLSFIGAAVFLAHPINSESVFYIAAVQEPLFFLFGILGLLILIKQKNPWFIVLAAIFTALSFFSKETGFLFFIISAFYLFLFEKGKLKIYLVASFVPVFTYFLMRTLTIGLLKNPLNAPITNLSFWERMLNVPAMMFFYLKTFLLPYVLGFTDRWVVTKINLDSFIFPLVIDFAVIGSIILLGAIVKRKQGSVAFKSWLFFTVWFAIGLLLHMQIYPLDMTVSERWFYFPIVGLLGLIFYGWQVFGENTNRKYAVTLVVAVLVLFSTRTFVRGFDWKTDLSISASEIKFVTDKFSRGYVMADVALRENRIDEAIYYAQSSIEAYPYFVNYDLLGDAYFKKGDYAAAQEAYMNGLKTGVYYSSVERLAIIATSYGDSREGEEFVSKMSDFFPKAGRWRAILAVLQYKNRELDRYEITMGQARILGAEGWFLDKCEKVIGGESVSPQEFEK